jgi:putative glycosyltransferase (TIGR04372 family)
LAAEELAERGYYVIRMGAKVNCAIISTHPKVIDYATNGMRSDFMDIYLGAKCAFCLTSGTGIDAISMVFRRPIVCVNMVPIGHFITYADKCLGIFKHHISTKWNQKLSLSDILSVGVDSFISSTAEFEFKKVQLIENTAEEIRDVSVEMVERIEGKWCSNEKDEVLQRRFWEIYPTKIKSDNGIPLHGRICAKVGSVFLRKNQEWIR